MQTDVSGPEAMFEFSAQVAIGEHSGHQGHSGRVNVQNDRLGPNAMAELSDQADNHEHYGPQGQLVGSQTQTGQVTPKAIDKFSMPAKSHLKNGTGLAGHDENDVDLTIPDLHVSPREHVPRTTDVSHMQKEEP
jgi:hypothetical protein